MAVRAAVAIVSWSLAAASSAAQDTTGRIAWRGRDVAGLEVVVHWTVGETRIMGSDFASEESGELRDIVLAAGPQGGRGVRIVRLDGRRAGPPIVEFFELDGVGVPHPLIGFGVGRRYPGSSPHFTRLVSVPIGWSRTIPRFDGAGPSGGGDAHEVVLDDDPPGFASLIGPSMKVRADVTDLGRGRRRIEFSPAPAIPFDAQRFGGKVRIQRFAWTATVDAADVLVGEERSVTSISRLFDMNDDGETHRCTWRESEVRRWEGEEFEALWNETEILRRAYEVLNSAPREALAHLDAYDAISLPHRLADEAASLRESAALEAAALERSVARAVDEIWLRGGDERADLKRHLGESILSPEDARRIHELGRRLAWVEDNGEARLDRVTSIVARIAKARGTEDRDTMLVATLLRAGGNYENKDMRRASCVDVVAPRVPPPPPPSDADQVNRRIAELVDEVLGR